MQSNENQKVRHLYFFDRRLKFKLLTKLVNRKNRNLFYS